MSERRRARGKPMTGPAGDPNHVRQEDFEHPVFGHVRVWFHGDKLRRIKWSSPDHGQPVHSRHSDPKKFTEILGKLGIEDGGS
ncbi:hypothetical protein [Arthrobacter psychrochitiniphilus]|uniref:hypothetical protein n=1 Tax=Arthrobacter psychrochitiniphilus TaxID=291045 RepID=UPI003F7C73B0